MLGLLFNRFTLGLLVILIVGTLVYFKFRNWPSSEGDNRPRQEQQDIQDTLRKATLAPPPVNELKDPEEARNYLAPVEDAK